jgi:hypothetical protein
MKVRAGKKVKERLSFRSKHDYKNYFYSASGSIPYAILLQQSKDGELTRKLIPVSSYQIAEVFRKARKFNEKDFINIYHPKYNNYDKKLLKVGQKVFVMQDDSDFKKRFETDFQQNRLFKITQFKYDGSKIMLQYHLESRSKGDIDSSIKIEKDLMISEYEKQLGINKIKPDLNIESSNDRNKDFEKRLYDFNKRLTIIKLKKDVNLMKNVKSEIEKFKTESSSIQSIGSETPILGLSQKKWNLLYENYDFEINLTGKLSWIED